MHYSTTNMQTCIVKDGTWHWLTVQLTDRPLIQIRITFLVYKEIMIIFHFSDKETLMDYIKEQDNLTRQLHLLQ